LDWKKLVYHDGSELYRYKIEGSSDNSYSLRIRVPKDVPIKSVYCRTNPDGEGEMDLLEEDSSFGNFRYFRVVIFITKYPFNYRFFIITDEDGYWFNEAGVDKIEPLDNFDFKIYEDGFFPSWLDNAVFYQIFPDRFKNGNPSITVKNGEYEYHGFKSRTRDWDDEKVAVDHTSLDFYGGDLQGIEDAIPYLKDLGVNVIYLNPIFLAPSNHKYDTQDYEMIDPHFGTNEDFARLIKMLHDNDIKIILDGVFNHVGISHKWFNKTELYDTGAYQDENSPYREFFKFGKNSQDYNCWKGIETLPKLNYKSEKLKDIVYRSADSICSKWMSEPYNLDGWRFDVANMLARDGKDQLHQEVWRDFRQVLKGNFPDCYLLGEHFFDGTDLQDGDSLDSLMNYQGFTFPIWRWLTGEAGFLSDWQRVTYTSNYNASDMARQMATFRTRFGYDFYIHQYNLLDGHDVPRFINLVNGNFDLYRIGLTLLFVYPGTPAVYYGDEVGLTGGGDPDNRRPMIWDKEKIDQSMLTLYKRLIKLRTTSKVLAIGGFMEIFVSSEIYCFARVLDKEAIVSIVCKGSVAQDLEINFSEFINNASLVTDFYGNEDIKINENGVCTIKLQSIDSRILLVS